MKKHTFTKLLSIALSIIISFSILNIQVFAAEQQQIKIIKIGAKLLETTIIQDNDSMRKVRVVDESNVTTATLNKKTGYLEVRYNNNIVANINMIETESSPIITPNVIVNPGGGGGTTCIDSGHDVYNKFVYFVYSSGMWSIKIPGHSKTPMGNTTNSTNLENFRNSVNNIAKKQLEITGTCGASALSIIGGLLAATPTTLGTSAIIAIFLGAGLGLVAAYMGADLYFIEKDAIYYFNKI